jgi:hypothetical protein
MRKNGNTKGKQVRSLHWFCLLVCFSATQASGQNGSAPGQQPGWLLNHGSLIEPGNLPQHLATALDQTGARMTSSDKAQLTIGGTITDSKGARPAQVSIQAPGYMIYREQQGHAVGFDGSGLKTNSGSLGANDDAIAESLLAHFPDAVCLQVATGGTYRRIGSHFRADNSTSPHYSGPYWTLLAFSPKKRPGLAAGKALQQELFIAVDENSGFISEVRVVVGSGPKPQQMTQTQFSDWRQQGGQWYPGTITRFEDGKQVMSFQVQTVTVGAAGPAAAFIP